MPTNLEYDNYLFKDRKDASKKLLGILPKEILQEENWILLALSRDSIPVASYIAKELDMEFDLLLMSTIFAPNNDECEIAKVSEVEEIVIHENLANSFGISLDYIYDEAKRKYEEDLLKCQEIYRKSHLHSSLNGRNVLFVVDGCETGFGVTCALKSVLAQGARKVSLATPIIAEDLYHMLDMKLDKIYTNYRIKDFIEVAYYYEKLDELKKEEVKDILKKSSNYVPFKGEK